MEKPREKLLLHNDAKKLRIEELLSIIPIYLSNLLHDLSSNGFIEKDGDYYKLRIESLFSGESYDL